jgi:hypothetical protein
MLLGKFRSHRGHSIISTMGTVSIAKDMGMAVINRPNVKKIVMLPGKVLCLFSGRCMSTNDESFLVMNSFVFLHNIRDRIEKAIDSTWNDEIAAKLGTAISTFSPNVVKNDLAW